MGNALNLPPAAHCRHSDLRRGSWAFLAECGLRSSEWGPPCLVWRLRLLDHRSPQKAEDSVSGCSDLGRENGILPHPANHCPDSARFGPVPIDVGMSAKLWCIPGGGPISTIPVHVEHQSVPIVLATPSPVQACIGVARKTFLSQLVET